MRVNAKVTFGTFHRESFGILRRRQPGFRQNAFLSDNRGRPQQNVWQKHFNSTGGYYAIRANVWQTWMLHYKHSHFHSSCSAETGPDMSSVQRCFFFTYFDKTFFVRKLELNRTTVVTVSKMIQRKDYLNIAKGTTDPRVEFILPK